MQSVCLYKEYYLISLLFSFQVSFLLFLKMSNCKVCVAVIKKNQLKLTCIDCKYDFHAKCVKMTQADVSFMEEQGSVWRCEPCGSMRRKSMRLEISSQEGCLTLDDIMKALDDIREVQKTTSADFNKSYEVLHEKLQENKDTLQSEMKKIAGYVKLIDELRSENATLRNKVTSMEQRIEDMESYSRRNSVEVQGIPEEPKENVLNIIKGVGKALDFEITDSMVDACHRVGRRTEDRPRGIIIKFVRRMDKDTMLHKRRERRRDFSTRHLGMAMDNPVFLNDSLSPAKRRLLGQTRQIKRDKGFKYLWLRNGNILLRKEEGSPVIEIKSQVDLAKL